METLTTSIADLFADNLPSLEQIKDLSNFVNSSEASKIEFTKKVEQKISLTSPEGLLAIGIALYIL